MERCLDVNEGSVKVTGMPREKLIGTDFSDYFTEPEKAREGYKRAFSLGSVTDYPLTIRHRDERLTDVLYNASVYKDSLGNVLGVFAAARDITERTRIASDLKKASNELLRSNAELDQFAAVASHDLQEPLRMIVSYVDLLKSKYGSLFDDQANRYMGIIADGGMRMTEMIRAILAYSQIGDESSKMSFVDSSIALGSAMANLKAKVADTQASIVDGPLPSVTANVNQLSQLFQNLLSNAMKFRSDHRACAIQVRAVEAKDEWTFLVADNGIGMDQEGALRIFQLFQRLHARDKYPGSGIGLATCKKIVEHHSGRIWVESTPDVGSTFFFTLPKR